MVIEQLTQICDQLFLNGRFTAAAAECDKALAGTLSTLDRCRVLQLKAQAVIAEDGRWGSPAVACLKEAQTLADGHPDEYGRVLCAFTAIYAAMGTRVNCQKARNEFVQLKQSSESPTLKRLYPRVEYNLAVVYHEIDMLDEALPAYGIARGLCERAEEPEARARVAYIDHNLVDIFQEQERYDEAKYLMDLSYHMLPEEQFGAQMRNRRAIHALQLGELDTSFCWVEAGLGHPSCDLKTRAALILTKAKLAHAMGQDVVAHDLTSEALRLAAIKLSSRLARRVLNFRNLLEKGEQR